jgi:hypothetical protein
VLASPVAGLVYQLPLAGPYPEARDSELHHTWAVVAAAEAVGAETESTPASPEVATTEAASTAAQVRLPRRSNRFRGAARPCHLIVLIAISRSPSAETPGSVARHQALKPPHYS